MIAVPLLGRRRLLAFAALALAGCAHRVPAPVEPGEQRYSGRMALRVEGDAPQSFTAGFELRGSPEKGELALFGPLGSTAAILSWASGIATLRAEGQAPQQFASLDALVTQVTGAPVPIAALFEWLAGVPVAVAGWHADLSQRAQGRLHARRNQPSPIADLRLVLEQP